MNLSFNFNNYQHFGQSGFLILNLSNISFLSIPGIIAYYP